MIAPAALLTAAFFAHDTDADYFSFGALILLRLLFPFAVAGAAVCFALPSLRARTSARVAGFFCCAIIAINLALTIYTGGAYAIRKASDAPFFVTHSRHLTQAQTIDGNSYPAGSDLVTQPGGSRVGSGTLPTPASILGIPLIAKFTITGDDTGTYSEVTGTLAAAQTIDTLPCAANAPIVHSSTGTTCRLAQGTTLHGFPLAPGSSAALRKQDGQQLLTRITLAAPLTIFDSPFPAGTMLGPMSSTAPSLEHLAAFTSGVLDLCLPAGAHMPFDQAILIGPVELTYNPDRIQILAGCPGFDSPQPSGSFTYQGKQFSAGSLSRTSHTWSDLQP